LVSALSAERRPRAVVALVPICREEVVPVDVAVALAQRALLRNPAPVYPLRMFGVRTVVLGAELRLPLKQDDRMRAMRIGILIHASDTLAAGLGGIRGQLPRRTAALLTGVSAVNTALAVLGSSAPRVEEGPRRWFRR